MLAAGALVLADAVESDDFLHGLGVMVGLVVGSIALSSLTAIFLSWRHYLAGSFAAGVVLRVLGTLHILLSVAGIWNSWGLSDTPLARAVLLLLGLGGVACACAPSRLTRR